MKRNDFDCKERALSNPPESYVVLDIETTGFSPETDAVIEIAAVKVTVCERVDEFVMLVNPGRHVSSRITKFTGITDADVEGASPISEVLPLFLEFLGDYPIVGHNVCFDIRFLSRTAERLELPPLSNNRYDTFVSFRRAYPGLPSYKLCCLAERLSLSTPSHRAMADVDTTIDLLEFLRSGAEQLPALAEVDPLAVFFTCSGDE